MKLVVAHYSEDLDWLNHIEYDTIVYSKGDTNPKFTTRVLPNVGREADTFLYHIINNYPYVTDTLVFLQGNPLDHCWDLYKQIEENKNTDQLVWLGSNWGPVTKNYDGGPGSVYLPLLDICYDLFGCSYDQTKTFTFSAGAQYIVPKKYVINKSIDWWKHCYSVFNKYIDTSPWAYERIWPMIWNYSTNQ